MRKPVFTWFLLIIVFLPALSFGQFLPGEIDQRARWEDFLRNARILAQDQPWGDREAVTNPWRLTLSKDGVTRKAIWKNVSGRQKGFIENWRWEIAAYALDKYLGINMIPPTVERRFMEERGSCQLMVESEMNLREKVRREIPTPGDKVQGWMRAAYLQQAFDNLIANEDRHQGNVLVTEDCRAILIDHSRTFRTSRKFTRNLIFPKKGQDKNAVMKELPLSFLEKMKSMDFDAIRGAVGEYLTDKEIRAILTRRDLLMKWLEPRIEDNRITLYE